MHSSQNRAAQYRSVRSHGLVAEASPTRLVQIVYEQILAELAAAQGRMERITNHLPLHEVVAKCAAMGKAIRLVGHLDATLNMEQGGEIAANLRRLYVYMMERLTYANAHNDKAVVAEVVELIRKIKSGWDQIVADSR
ncbi:MAG TPA: flagellar export chaperone FliS [Steroidobacteraceae bacterium]|nr:flagellar export chaperone FliS [Steroidobacteraceae bacterium]